MAPIHTFLALVLVPLFLTVGGLPNATLPSAHAPSKANASHVTTTKEYYLGYESETLGHVEGRFTPYLVILQRRTQAAPYDNNNNKELGASCDPETFVDVLVALLSLFCALPGYCYPRGVNLSQATISPPPSPNITSGDVLWKYYMAGPSKVYLKFLVLIPRSPLIGDYVPNVPPTTTADSHSFISPVVLQDVLSRMSDVIEARLGCQVINPIRTYYTYAFWVIPLIAGIIFFLLLTGVVLIYHLWDPRIEEKMKSKLMNHEEGTKLISKAATAPDDFDEKAADPNPYFPQNDSPRLDLKDNEVKANGDNTSSIDDNHKHSHVDMSRI